MSFLKKPYVPAILTAVVLILFTGYVLLDTFVIPRAGTPVQPPAPPTTGTTNGRGEPTKPSAPSEPIITDTEYRDDNIHIQITTHREYDTDIYVADIHVSDPAYLKTAFAKNAYGRNIAAATSKIAAEQQAILAVNGDYYGARGRGYVIRGGVLYRDTPSGNEEQEVLVIDQNGAFRIEREDKVSAQKLLDGGAREVLSFGPGLIENGEITANAASKVRPANPRTAIGMYEPGHYVFVVADGRSDKSAGLRFEKLAEFMHGLGVQVAYNLDGGGSSAMVFNGRLLNHPTTDGKTFQERGVSDIVCITG